MTPTQFFETFVEGNAEDYLDHLGDVRRAFNAAVSASQAADHYYEYNQRHHPQLVGAFTTVGKFVEHLSTETAGAFRDIRSVANAYKHLYTDPSSRFGAHASINSCGAIERVEFLDGELASMCEDLSDSQSQVIFTRRDGSRSAFAPLLASVVAYWRGTLSADT